jgi:UDP-arabinose 4-epimerase
VNILVTGGAGYIGSLTCKELHKRGHKVIVFDNLSNSESSFVKWGELVQGDINNKELLFATIEKNKIEAVFHFAGVIEVGESMRDPMKYMLNNVVGTFNLLEGIAKYGVKHVIFSSSCATYGNCEKVPISEDNVQLPVSVYGETKLFGERMIHDLSVASNLCSVVLRYFNAAGADPDGETGERHDPETHLVPLVIRSVFDKDYTLQVFGNDYPTSDGTCVRDYAHVTDLAVAHVKALEWSMKTKTPFEAFNLGTGKGSTVMEVIKAVEKCTQGKVKYELQPRRPGDSTILVADIHKAKSVLGWNPELSDLETVVSTACKWHAKISKY